MEERRKAHLAKVSLALLSAVFLFGCQEQGSGAVGPEGPQFDKAGDPEALCGEEGGPVRDEKGHCHGEDGDGDNPGSDSYEFTFATGSDITTDPETASASGGGGGGVVFLSAFFGGGELILTSALLVDVGGAAAAKECFEGITLDEDWRGRLTPDKKDMNQVEARFLLDFKDKDGNPVRYRLILAPGTAVDNENENEVFPPEPGTSMTGTYSNTFKIEAQRKKEKNA